MIQVSIMSLMMTRDYHYLSLLVTVVNRRTGKLLFCCSVVGCDSFYAVVIDISKFFTSTKETGPH